MVVPLQDGGQPGDRLETDGDVGTRASAARARSVAGVSGKAVSRSVRAASRRRAADDAATRSRFKSLEIESFVSRWHHPQGNRSHGIGRPFVACQPQRVIRAREFVLRAALDPVEHLQRRKRGLEKIGSCGRNRKVAARSRVGNETIALRRPTGWPFAAR